MIMRRMGVGLYRYVAWKCNRWIGDPRLKSYRETVYDENGLERTVYGRLLDDLPIMTRTTKDATWITFVAEAFEKKLET